MVVEPRYVLAPASTCVPGPLFTRLMALDDPLSLIVPLKVLVPEEEFIVNVAAKLLLLVMEPPPLPELETEATVCVVPLRSKVPLFSTDRSVEAGREPLLAPATGHPWNRLFALLLPVHTFRVVEIV